MTFTKKLKASHPKTITSYSTTYCSYQGKNKPSATYYLKPRTISNILTLHYSNFRPPPKATHVHWKHLAAISVMPFPSQTFKVGEKKVPLFSCLVAPIQWYGHFLNFYVHGTKSLFKLSWSKMAFYVKKRRFLWWLINFLD